MNEFVRIDDPLVPPGFGFMVRPLRQLDESPSFSPNPAIEITKHIRKLKRKLARLVSQKDRLLLENPTAYAWNIVWYKSNIKHLEQKLKELGHFVA